MTQSGPAGHATGLSLAMAVLSLVSGGTFMTGALLLGLRRDERSTAAVFAALGIALVHQGVVGVVASPARGLRRLLCFAGQGVTTTVAVVLVVWKIFVSH